MIEKALRRRLQPIVKRRRRLHLAYFLSVCWSVAAIVGIGLIIVNRYFGWKSPIANWALCISTVLATLYAFYRSRRMQPDYKAVARHIERQNPDLKALLLAAIEQQPIRPDGQFGYLQDRVIGEAVRHATKHDWLKSISTKKLLLAELGGALAFALIITTLLQLFPAVPFLRAPGLSTPVNRGYEITVSPGDTSVEAGSPVVILARFGRRVPSKANLLFGEPGEEFKQIPLARNLDDPVFGGIIQQVNSNLLYYIEYADQRSRDYSISIYERPVLRRADAKIIFPSYTKLSEKVIKDTRQVSAVEGSQVILTFILNKAVAKAQLVPKEGSTLELTVTSEHPNVYTTSITATKNERYELHLADARGLTNEVPPRFVIDVHKNLPPELKVVFPNRDVLASPLEELSLEAEVSDDYGVAGYGLSYALAGDRERDVTLGPSPSSSDKQQIQHLLELEELNAQPDQLLTYYFWADDMGPDGKIRRTSGDMYFAEVRHFDEVFRESQSSPNQQQNQQGQQQGGRQGEQLAQLQKQIISATWNIKRQTDQSGSIYDSKEDLGVVHQSQADVLEQARSASAQAEDPAASRTLQTAARHMETSLEHLGQAVESESATELMPALAAEQSAYQELLKLRQREHQVGQSRNSSASNSARSARSERQLQQLELAQRENRYETERLAQSQEQAAQREDLQILNRLRDLARRQNDMSNKLKDVQAALRQARTEQERQEIQRQLKRLREEQLQALRDVDELQQRMNNPENRQRMADASEQLDQSRSRIRRSAEELEQGMVSRAVTSATRAQRQLEQMRDEFRRNTSGQFTEQMRDMRQQAQQLDQRQKEIAEDIQQQIDSDRKSLTDSAANRELAEQMNRQKESVEELLEQMKDVSEQSENSEPLLSRKLYDTLRRTSGDNLDRALEVTSELLRRNFLPQAQEVEQRAGKGIEELRKGIEDAAESVLGDEAESLRLAREQLDELIRQVNEESARAVERARQDGDPNSPDGSTASRRQLADAQAGTGRGQQGDPNSTADIQENQRRLAGDRRSDDRTGGARTDPTGGGGNQRGRWDQFDPNGPLTGREFTQWSDRLRDVEEMLSEPDLRNDIARVRDRARAIRAEFTRHGKEPQWNLVEQFITNPLTELRKRIGEELAKLKSDEAMVPIDRDPVPGRYAELVRRYYENLGGDE